MATVFNILAILVMVAVVIVLIRGLVNMMRGGSGNTSNKLMQARVLLQFIALVLILLGALFRRAGLSSEADMVKLNKIYTRTGDDGTTGLGTGERRLKSDLRVEAYGTVDEANACIGLARLHTAAAHPEIDAMLGRIQNDLFDLGADLARARYRQEARLRAAAHHRRADRAARSRHRPAQQGSAAAAILHPARRLAGGGGTSSRPHRDAARRAHDGGAGRRTRPSTSTARASNTSTASPISCSSPAGWSMTTETPTCYGFPARTAESDCRSGSGTRCSFRSTTPTA